MQTRRQRAGTPEHCERLRSADGRRSNDRYCCEICAKFSDNPACSTFSRGQVMKHPQTKKHQLALERYQRKLDEEQVARTDPQPAAHVTYLASPNLDPPPAELPSLFHGLRRLDDTWIDDDGNELMLPKTITQDETWTSQRARDFWCEVEDTRASEDFVDPEMMALLEDTAAHVRNPEASMPGGFLASEVTEYFPYSSKTMFILDLLDNKPRLRLSDEHMRSVLWTMKELGVSNVPSLKQFRGMQQALSEKIDIVPRHHVSAMGNHFYQNSPSTLLALDWANPLVRESIKVYPEITPKVTEFWQAGKWVNEVPLEELTPMWADWERDPDRHFYVGEVARTRGGKYVIPRRWVIFDGEEHAEVSKVQFSETTKTFSVVSGAIDRIPASELAVTYLELESLGYQATFPGSSRHPTRDIASGRPVFSLRVMPWADDVSGNRTKQYNPHINLYMQNINVPHKLRKQQFFTRFCSTSKHATSNEQFRAYLEDCGREKYLEAYDCRLKREILFQIFPHCLPADGPQQAESSSGVGGGGNLNCIRDKSGGSKEEKESDEGYHALFSPDAEERTVEDTVDVIKKQLILACCGVALHVSDLQTETGIKDKTAQFWIDQALKRSSELTAARVTNSTTRDPRLNSSRCPTQEKQAIRKVLKDGIKEETFNWLVSQPKERWEKLPEDSPLRNQLRPGDHFNALLGFPGLSVHRDSPGDLLHLVLLGLDRYEWFFTSSPWNESKDAWFAAGLRSSSVDGLNLSPVDSDYLVSYKNNLVGRHFKIITQLAIFHLHWVGVDRLWFDLWKATGALNALLWYPEIQDVTQYTADLEIAVANVLDTWASIDPNRIIAKPKLHILTHLADNVRRFGPPILYQVEGFEGWNQIFRTCSVLSNHHAPSRDIAITTGNMERFKHIVSGGWWWDKDSKQHVQAGRGILEYFASNPTIQRHLGWSPEATPSPGSITQVPKAKQPTDCTWDSLFDTIPPVRPPGINEETLLVLGESVVSVSGDTCSNGSWVFYNTHCEESPSKAARIFKIITGGTHARMTFVILEPWEISASRDERYGMPTLHRDHADSCFGVPPKDIYFVFNAQHDCEGGKCTLHEVDAVQERQETSKKLLAVAHSDYERYFINTHALHNCSLLRKVLPRSLTAPVPWVQDRRKLHGEMARHLQKENPEKRAEVKAKAKATRDRKKKDKKAD